MFNFVFQMNKKVIINIPRIPKCKSFKKNTLEMKLPFALKNILIVIFQQLFLKSKYKIMLYVSGEKPVLLG